MKRVLTALVLIPFAVYTIYFGPREFFMAVVAVMALFCYHEYIGISAAHGLANSLWGGSIAGLALLWSPDLTRAVLIVVLTTAMRVRDLAKYLPTSGAAVLGVLWIFGAWRCAIDLHALSPHWVFFSLAINWVGDIAAFYVGRKFGRHKLARRVSPGKSWEGAVASTLAAIGFGVVFDYYLHMPTGTVATIFLSMLANISGQVGDLVESAMKRGAGIKDSGTFLPGHGGFLDRLDSSLFTMPIVYYFLQIRHG